MNQPKKPSQAPSPSKPASNAGSKPQPPSSAASNTSSKPPTPPSSSPAHSDRADATNPNQASASGFHNPYTFVPTPPRPTGAEAGFAGDFDPVESGLRHDELQPDLWTGRIPIQVTAITPLLLMDVRPDKVREERGHKTYTMLRRLEESSLRGVLRSAYEAATNSRFPFFRNHEDRLGYRGAASGALSLIPARIESNEEGQGMEIRLLPGDVTLPNPNNRAIYTAKLPFSFQNRWKHGERVFFKHDRKKVVTDVRAFDDKGPRVDEHEGYIFFTNKNAIGKKYERIFYQKGQGQTYEYSIPEKAAILLRNEWRMLIQSYWDANDEEKVFLQRNPDPPWKYLSDDIGRLAWSPHQYQGREYKDKGTWKPPQEDPKRFFQHDARELRVGDLVYAQVEFKDGTVPKSIKLYPVSISRILFKSSPLALLDPSLRPAKRLSELSPADRLFGWVAEERATSDDVAYRGRIRVVADTAYPPDQADLTETIQGSLPLAILGQPKPTQARFYVAADRQGSAPKKGLSKIEVGYSDPSRKALRGRKFYWHHRHLEAWKEGSKTQASKLYWRASSEDRTQRRIDVGEGRQRYQEYRKPDGKDVKDVRTDQNRSISEWIRPGTAFSFWLDIENLQTEELGALLWLLSLPKDHYFRLGYGKPLGFGSVRIEIPSKNPLPAARSEDWLEYYTSLAAPIPSKLTQDEIDKAKQAFENSMSKAYNAKPFGELPFVQAFLQICKGPEADAPIHYPRTSQNDKRPGEASPPNPEGKNFEWFVSNEREVRGSLAEGHPLPEAKDSSKTLPYLRKTEKGRR